MARSIIRLLAVVGVLVIGAATAIPASAEAFRYWGYYAWSGDAWAFADAGSNDTNPADGSVEGWRFAVAGEASARLPRAAGDFDTLCGSTPESDGSKRVGVVIDFGTQDDAPEGDTAPAPLGACAVVPEDATGSDVLVAVAEVRLGDGGFVCGIDGYPSQGCGDPVDSDAPTSEEEPVELELAAGDDSSSTPAWAPIALGVAAIVVVATAALTISRRRSPGDAPDA
jgi:hypothetical protein